MKFCSIDIESTGLDLEKCQVLQIGAIIEDTLNIKPLEECPTFNCIIIHDELTGSPFALNMNKMIIRHIRDWQIADEDGRKQMSDLLKIDFLRSHEVAEHFHYFLFRHGLSDTPKDILAGGHRFMYKGDSIPKINNKTKPTKITVAGKNFGTFDKIFLERLPRWNSLVRFKQRILDPSALYVDFFNDEEIPNLKTCKERAGIGGVVTHDAVEDAWDVILVLRKKYGEKKINK